MPIIANRWSYYFSFIYYGGYWTRASEFQVYHRPSGVQLRIVDEKSASAHMISTILAFLSKLNTE